MPAPPIDLAAALVDEMYPPDQPSSYEAGTGQAAEFLGVHRTTVVRWGNGGLLPYLRLPSGQRRYRLADLRAAARRVGAATETEIETRVQED